MNVLFIEFGGLGWFDGFDEFFVCCGFESNGVLGFDEDGWLKYLLYGCIGNKLVCKLIVFVDDEMEEVKIEGVVDEVRFYFFKLRFMIMYWIGLDDYWIEIYDEVENFLVSDVMM